MTTATPRSGWPRSSTSSGYDAYDVGPLAEGWRYQRDTAAYAGLYSASPAGVWPPTASRQVTEELLRDRLAQAKRYRDMEG